MTLAARRWTPEELASDLARAVEDFRRERMREPLEQYLELFGENLETFRELLARTGDLTRLAEEAPALLGDARTLEALRYLPGPPISADDLETLVEGPLSARGLRADPALAGRVVATVLLGLDRRRFPWVAEGRAPGAGEREASLLASAALLATSRVQTRRRNRAKALQEERVMDALRARGYRQVERRAVATMDDAPAPGEFCAESLLGNRKADVVLRLWDRRILPIECKVSNSALNSVKRLNNDAAAKAEAWRRDFGERHVVPTAVLSGVYRLHNLEDAQERGLSLFWAHALDALVDWVEATRPPGGA